MKSARGVVVLLLVCSAICAAAAAAAAAEPVFSRVPWYTCEPSTCDPAANCFCAGTASPLPSEETPQFILYTHDDAIDDLSDTAMRSILDSGRTNPNGCKIPATFFTIKTQTDCALAKALWQEGSEIALHTIHHPQLFPKDFPGSAMQDEMMGVRTWLNETCGIPLDDLVGWRSPYLITNPEIRKVLSANNILYDSSINEHWADTTSLSGKSRIWPYTMDNGIPEDCAWVGAPNSVCDQSERYKGLWEVPVWVLQKDDYPNGAYAMDPKGDVYGLLKGFFDSAYAGNRAPVPIYIHGPWMAKAENQAAVGKFLDYALGKPNVWVVTMRQMLDWIRNPVPASQMSALFECNPGGANAFASMPAKPVAAAPAVAPLPAVVVPSPAAVVPSTPAPVPAVPSPTPAGPTPSVPAGSYSLPRSGINIHMTLTGSASAEAIRTAVAATLHVDPSSVYIVDSTTSQLLAGGAAAAAPAAAAGRRRLRQAVSANSVQSDQAALTAGQAQPQQQSLTVVVAAEDPSALQAKCEDAISSGQLQLALASIGAQQVGQPQATAFLNYDGNSAVPGIAEPAAGPSPAAVRSPPVAPISSSSVTTSSSSPAAAAAPVAAAPMPASGAAGQAGGALVAAVAAALSATLLLAGW